MNNTQRGWWCALPLAACASAPAIGADKTAEKEPGETLVVVGQASAKGVQSYQPLTSVTGTRTETSLLNVPQAIDVVPQQVITDQAVSSLDEAPGMVDQLARLKDIGKRVDPGLGDRSDV